VPRPHVQTGFGTVSAGTASVVHFELQALSGGRPFAVVEHVDCIARDAGNQWKQPFGPADMSYRIEVEGDPSYTVAMQCARRRPGLLSPLQVPRYWGGNRIKIV
jgi:2,4-diaminopentanoate dehydrogenase